MGSTQYICDEMYKKIPMKGPRFCCLMLNLTDVYENIKRCINSIRHTISLICLPHDQRPNPNRKYVYEQSKGTFSAEKSAFRDKNPSVYFIF
jgi:hypothetical protein